MKAIVISQAMFFPWVGFLEQLRLADAFVDYDDVQFSKGSFTNRVQIKSQKGNQWLTVPLANLRLGQRIMDVVIDNTQTWQDRHLQLLRAAYCEAPFVGDMLTLVESVYSRKANTIGELAHTSTIALLDYFCLVRMPSIKSSELCIPGNSWARVLQIVKSLGGNKYITGHGARNYLDHNEFEINGVDVQYMNYLKVPYEQRHGAFTPYVSALDVVANCGRGGARVICSPAIPWRDFLCCKECE